MEKVTNEEDIYPLFTMVKSIVYNKSILMYKLNNQNKVVW